jgi:hypothetical protein
MSERKSDDLMATGAHKQWTGEQPSSVVRAGTVAPEAPRSWLSRTQPANPRHATITRSLYSWSNYKNWTEKVKNSWEREKSAGSGNTGAPGNTGGNGSNGTGSGTGNGNGNGNGSK